jgi:hypothetical protein
LIGYVKSVENELIKVPSLKIARFVKVLDTRGSICGKDGRVRGHTFLGDSIVI